MKIKATITLGAVLVTGLVLSACTTQVQNEPAVMPAKVTGTAHTHPANECTNSISHSHPNGDNAHKHRYSCKPKKMRSANEHTHPANRCTRSISHAHPNGQGTHQHRYSCKGNGRLSNAGNGHFHPANSMTRSTRHNHPNGAGKHSHHYSR
ncbi:MAG: hypothetical protein L3J51_12010 [Cocleimonas sp.]|nr:hypothetical protein [Cocleimonas sp.]